MNDNRKQLQQMLKGKVSPKQALDFFDQLEPMQSADMMGGWKGEELTTGHPMEGLLGICKWHGKNFVNEESVHPLVFEAGDHTLFYANPGMIPLNLPIGKIPKKLVALLFRMLRPFIRTKKSRARLRMVHYRGKVSASMVYDQLAIVDVFRRVDNNTVLGMMDIKQKASGGNYFFVLYRE